MIFFGKKGGGGGGGDPFNDQLELVMNFDGTDGDTTFSDEGPNSLTFTATGTAKLVNNRVLSAAFSTSFDAGDGYCNIGPSAGLQLGGDAFTWEFRYYWDTYNSFQTLLQAEDSPSLTRFRIWNKSPEFRYTSSTTNFTLKTTFNTSVLNEWKEFCVTRSANGDFYSYLDGIKNNGPFNFPLAQIDWTGILAIGGRPSSTVMPWPGNIQGARLTRADRYGGNNYTMNTDKYPAYVAP